MKRLNDDIGDMCGRAFSGYHSDTVLTVKFVTRQDTDGSEESEF